MRYAELANELAVLMENHLGTRGSGLEAKIRKVGRLLPRRIKNQAGVVIDAAKMQDSPKLARQIDHDATLVAFDDCKVYLSALDKSERRKTQLISFVTTNAFNLVVIAALVIIVLVWRGFI